MTFGEASKTLESLQSKIKTEAIDVANLGGKKLEEELVKYQIEMARRDRLGPFQAYNVEQRIAEQEQQMGSQEEDVQLATAAAQPTRPMEGQLLANYSQQRNIN